jgi:hypothetical protein
VWKKSEQSGDGALRHAQRPSRPVHALLGGIYERKIFFHKERAQA